MTKQGNSIKIIVNNKGLYSKHYMKTKTVFYQVQNLPPVLSNLGLGTQEII